MPQIPTIQEDALSDQILQAALQLYQKRGFNKVTMEDVARAIGKTRSALYYYYKDSDEVFKAVLNTMVNKVFADILAAVKKATTPDEKINAFIVAKITSSKYNRNIFKSIEAGMNVEEKSKHARLKSAQHQRIIKLESSLLKQILTDTAKKGEISSMKPAEQDRLIFILLGSIRGIRNEMWLEDDFSKLSAVAGSLTDMVIAYLNR
jgi:AcrR family transcriptional regulator